ncbi:MAG: DUF2339 domain-containing protein [Spirochaetales bacterium]|nr:DUF2339 domain-containing protein [Spirochaetales bacterium]
MSKIDMNKTTEILKKYWILVIGFLLVFAALLYFIRVGYDDGWIPPIAIVFLGFISGAAGAIAGIIVYRKEYKIIGEIIAGFSCGIIYATIAYSNFANIWADIITLVIIILITLVLSVITYIYNLRILTALGLSAALFAPFIVKASEFHFFILFIYGFTINAAILFFAIMKKWKELPIIGLIITALLYIGYYFIFNTLIWVEPFSYITLIFILYIAGLFIAAKRDDKKPPSFYLILLTINLLLYAFWTCFIFYLWRLNISIGLLILGFVALLIAGLITIIIKTEKKVILSYFLSGILLVAISGFILGASLTITGMEHVIRGAVWVILTALLFFAGYKTKNNVLAIVGILSWFLVLMYWFSHAWDIAHVKWFGVTYIPFINPPGLLWSAIALLGFLIAVFSKRILNSLQKVKNKQGLMYGIVFITFISHLTAGILLTFQIQYLWKFYTIAYNVNIIYSVCWGVYALVLFLWGYLNKEEVFIYFADVILVIVAIKVIFFDMAGETNIFKAATILLTGIIIIIIGFFNYKRQTALAFEEKNKKEKAESKAEKTGSET